MVGISLFFSAYVVALAVQWKLALITMSIIPAIFLSIGTVMRAVLPVETEIVSQHSVLIYWQKGVGHSHPASSDPTLFSRSDDSSRCPRFDQNHPRIRRGEQDSQSL